LAEAFYRKEMGKTLFEELAGRISRIRNDEARRKLGVALEEVREEAAAAKVPICVISLLAWSSTPSLNAAAALCREWADAVSKIYVNVELLKRDVESSLVKKPAMDFSGCRTKAAPATTAPSPPRRLAP
jgi:hypothetical protein